MFQTSQLKQRKELNRRLLLARVPADTHFRLSPTESHTVEQIKGDEQFGQLDKPHPSSSPAAYLAYLQYFEAEGIGLSLSRRNLAKQQIN